MRGLAEIRNELRKRGDYIFPLLSINARAETESSPPSSPLPPPLSFSLILLIIRANKSEAWKTPYTRHCSSLSPTLATLLVRFLLSETRYIVNRSSTRDEFLRVLRTACNICDAPKFTDEHVAFLHTNFLRIVRFNYNIKGILSIVRLTIDS